MPFIHDLVATGDPRVVVNAFRDPVLRPLIFINAIDSFGRTALFYLYQASDPVWMHEILTHFGIDLTRRDYSGCDFVEYYLEWGYQFDNSNTLMGLITDYI